MKDASQERRGRPRRSDAEPAGAAEQDQPDAPQAFGELAARMAWARAGRKAPGRVWELEARTTRGAMAEPEQPDAASGPLAFPARSPLPAGSGWANEARVAPSPVLLADAQRELQERSDADAAGWARGHL
jgi:hypothetical protein